MGSTVIIAPSFIAILGGLSLLIWVLLVGLARRGRRVFAIAALLLAFALSGATAADAVNIHYSYMPRLDDVVGIPTWPTSSVANLANQTVAQGSSIKHGTVVSISISGKYSGFHGASTLVYLPPQYLTQPSQRFPVFYMLHGTPGAPVDWFRAANAASVGDQLASSGKAALLVAPPVSQGWLDDSECVDRPSEHIEQYVTQDVVANIDSRFRTIESPGDRVVAGMSAGGYCALNIGLKHSDMFGAIIDMSGYDRPTHAGGMTGLFGKRNDLDAVVSNNTPKDYLARGSKKLQRVWLDSGSSDLAASHDIKQVGAELQKGPDAVVINVRPGGHTYRVWRPAMAQSFPWAIGS